MAEGYVNYLGVSDDVRAEIAAADCIVLPSYHEGAPSHFIRSRCDGAAYITTDAVGCREVVDDNSNGYLCQVRSAPDLAEKMTRMITLSDAQRTEMGLREDGA